MIREIGCFRCASRRRKIRTDRWRQGSKLTRFPRFGSALSTHRLLRSLLRVFAAALSAKWISILSGSTPLVLVHDRSSCLQLLRNRSSWYPNRAGLATPDELINLQGLTTLILWRSRETEMRILLCGSYIKEAKRLFSLSLSFFFQLRIPMPRFIIFITSLRFTLPL